MKCLIVSDSHGLHHELLELVDRHEEEVDLFIHCGDSELSGEDEVIIPYRTVQGNCDFGKDFPETQFIQFGKWPVFVTHGHLYNVKSTLMNLVYKSEEAGAKVVCFGHSHIAGAEKIGDCLFINPGSIRLPKGSKHKTYAILEQRDDQAIVDFYTLEGKHLPEWRMETTLS